MGQEKILGAWLDPFGRKIVLTLQRWTRHILVNHPDMIFRLEDVGKTIQEPEFILRQGNDRLYFRKSRDKRGIFEFKVVASIGIKEEKFDGFVRTAFIQLGGEEKGEIEWSRG